MGNERSHSYLKQFLGGRGEVGALPATGGNYRDRFMAASQQGGADHSPGEVEKSALPGKEQGNVDVLRDPRFLWSERVTRFADQDLPSLSQASIHQLESNFRELMIVEANINALLKKGNTVYVSSCSDRDGKTIAATSTAYALAFYSGKNVLLVDGNYHNPQIHSLFGVTQSPGCHDLLHGRATLEQVILPTRHKGLSILTMGDTDAAPYGQEQLTILVEKLSHCFDYVVWDGGSIMTSSLALRDLVHFSGALLVVECEKTRWEVVQIAGDKIKKSGGPTAIGVVYNRRKYYIPKRIYNLIS